MFMKLKYKKSSYSLNEQYDNMTIILTNFLYIWISNQTRCLIKLDKWPMAIKKCMAYNVLSKGHNITLRLTITY